MDRVLEKALTLGLCKVACGFLSLPALPSSLSSVSLCCSCLLLFTDLAVTVFLAVLWWAGSSQLPLPAVPNDVIALRFLLFLGHAYGTALLLTAPLVAVEMACRLRRPQKWGGDKKRRGHMKGQQEGTMGAILNLNPSAEVCGAQCCDLVEPGQKVMDDTHTLMHSYGFLSCVAVWILCGLRGGLDRVLKAKQIESCVLETGSLGSCLPNLPDITVDAAGDPTLVLLGPALLLALALSLSVSWRGPTQDPLPLFRRQERAKTQPSPLLPECPETVSEGAVQNSHYMHNVCLFTLTESRQSVFTSHQDGSGFTHTHKELSASTCSAHTVAQHVVITLDDSLDPVRAASPGCAAHPQGWGLTPGAWLISCFGGRLLTGLVCGATLCLFPPAVSVNILLIRSVEGLTEWTLRNILSAWNEKPANSQQLLSTLHTDREIGCVALTVNVSLGEKV